MSWTFDDQTAFDTYTAFITSIDNAVAGSDEYGNLAWHIDCSAMANGATMAECLDTARMILDCWQDFYPQLIKSNEES
jgi:hypothetical protein